MTKTTQKLIAELEAELKKLPDDEQEKRVASYLEDAQTCQKEQEQKSELYEPFQILLNADLDLPPDYSENYEDYLYGDKELDE